MSDEPDWIRHAIWWRVYPLGFAGAFPEPAAGPAVPGEHRLLRLVPWLDHVVELGASGIALGPIFASDGHGYDTVDHLRLDPRLGEEGDFDELVAQAHARGLRVQLDGVFNHVGRRHPIAAAALEAGPDAADAVGGLAALLRTEVVDGARCFVAFEGHDQLLTLDHDSEEVRRLVVDVMRHWLDRGADAWRLDAAYAVPASFWAAVLPEVRRTHPDVWFEAEVIHGDYAAFVQESTADSVTQYELWKAVWSSLNDRNLHELAWTLTRHDALLETFAPATFIGNHDVTRIASRLEEPRHLPHAIALLAVLGGTPTVYAGDEYGIRGVKEERVGGDDAIRPEFPASPDPDSLAATPGFEDADERVLRLHQRLIGLRRRHPWLHRATSEAVELRNDRATFELRGEGRRLRVSLNLGEGEAPLPDSGGLVLLDADDASRGAPGVVAPFGWVIEGEATA